MLQDSFSTEHSIRNASDGFKTILGIKSYGCTKNSAQHTHALATGPSNGDVVFKKTNVIFANDVAVKNMKPEVMGARSATRDLIVAFVKSLESPERSREAFARKEAVRLVNKWFTYNETSIIQNAPQPQNGKMVPQSFGQAAVDKCLKDLSEPPTQSEATATACLKTIKMLGQAANGKDKYLDLWFNWAYARSADEKARTGAI